MIIEITITVVVICLMSRHLYKAREWEKANQVKWDAYFERAAKKHPNLKKK